MIELPFAGLGAAGIALSVNRLALGTFFSLSGYHKLFNPKRHEAIYQTMRANDIPQPYIMSWVVPGFELACGLSLGVGLLAPLASLALLAICLVATSTDGRKRIAGWSPLDPADRLDDYLYLPECLYMVMLTVVLFCGSGTLSIDHLILKLL